MSSTLPPLIAIVGPTASGKTSLSVELAKAFNGEIISADSRQIYREMSIGTAKVTTEEMDDVPHHLVDVCDPIERYSVADFQRDAMTAIDDILAREKQPFLVGGTGLYVTSVLQHWNVQRSSSDLEALDRLPEKYRYLQLGITHERPVLYDRINRRVDLMMRNGFLEEVRVLRKKYGCDAPAMNAIGYSHLCRHLSCELSLEESVELLKQDTRRYAKRQLTWFRHHGDISWISSANETSSLISPFLSSL